MVGTSVLGQHALSHQIDGSLNTYLNDKFTYFFYLFLKERSVYPNSKQSAKSKKAASVRLSDFEALFPYEKIQSDLRIKSTHKTKNLSQIYLHEYIPMQPIDMNMERYSYEDVRDDLFF